MYTAQNNKGSTKVTHQNLKNIHVNLTYVLKFIENKKGSGVTKVSENYNHQPFDGWMRWWMVVGGSPPDLDEGFRCVKHEGQAVTSGHITLGIALQHKPRTECIKTSSEDFLPAVGVLLASMVNDK